jgi:hypothetical protein
MVGVALRSRALVGAVAVGALLATPAADARSYVIQGDYKIGGYAVKKDGTLYGAIRAFGQPSSVLPFRSGGRVYREVCVARWRPLGLRISFYNLGGQDPCRPQFGYFNEATLTGKHWRTANGLRIGHPWRYIFRYHPKARPSPVTRGWWWLLTRHTVIGEGGPYGALTAKVVDGTVVAFAVSFPAGGD